MRLDTSDRRKWKEMKEESKAKKAQASAKRREAIDGITQAALAMARALMVERAGAGAHSETEFESALACLSLPDAENRENR